jgi:SAM-dependent methyltransferase
MDSILETFTKSKLVTIGKRIGRHVSMNMNKDDMIYRLLTKKQVGGNDQKYSSTDYWDNRYSEQGYNHFDWLYKYDELKPVLQKYINKSDRILVPGSGNALLSPDMYKAGYHNQDCVDISPSVTKLMSKKYSDCPGMDFKQMDILSNNMKNQYYDSIVDKSIIDTFACHDDKLDKINNLFNEYHRVLKPNGKCMVISLHNKDWVQPYINNQQWDILEAFDEQKKNGSIHSIHILNKK